MRFATITITEIWRCVYAVLLHQSMLQQKICRNALSSISLEAIAKTPLPALCRHRTQCHLDIEIENIFTYINHLPQLKLLYKEYAREACHVEYGAHFGAYIA